MDRIFGGNPWMVLLRLAILSVVVGVVLAALDLSPLAIFDYARIFMLRIYHMGFSAVGWLVNYFLIGAIIVFPIWLAARLWKLYGGSGRGQS